MGYELEGTIIKKGELQTLKNDFKKIDIVIETNGKYPQKVKFEVLKDNADKVNEELNEGNLIRATFDVRGNEYNDKYYVSLIMYSWMDITPDLIP